ncbi:MAG: trehalose-6-phosphate synthase [Siculibacillus sp.]|nr:trehalose-6-phosphate synthase [Siculibacillus sp.]
MNGARFDGGAAANGLGARLGRLLRIGLVRYALALAGFCLVLVLALAPLASVLVEGWARQDVDLRSRLVHRSVRERVASLEVGGDADLTPFFEHLAADERLLALGYCADEKTLRFATRLMPPALDCAGLPLRRTDATAVRRYAGVHVHVGVYPMRLGPVDGHLLVLHDLAYVDERAATARIYTILALASAVVGLGLAAAGVVFVVVRRWTRLLMVTATRVDLAAPPVAGGRPVSPFSREFRALVRELRTEKKAADGIHVDWSPDTLRRLLTEELPGVEVLVVSNREPYIHDRTEAGEIELKLPASGLVAALEPVMRTCGGTWIAHGSGSADRETVDETDRLRVPPAAPDYTLRRVWLDDDEVEGYYYGFANEGLWPLCHIAFVRPAFRARDFERYRAVNERFAEMVVAEAGRDDPIVLVQDYHFALLPRMIRRRLPKATIVTFWHIPWPNAETFGICPWREEIIDGLLGSSILGFHTRQHCNNFIEATDRFIESRIDREHDSVTLAGHDTLIRPYPISIEWPPAALAAQRSIAECREAVRARLGLPQRIRLAVGIERFDYTKGILDRMAAVDELLVRHPDWREKVVFVQAAAPSRSTLEAYRSLQAEAIRLAAEINARHGTGTWQPIRLVIRHHDQSEVYELFRAADVCVVSSLHDGMNLVAKEFVAARDDERGVLVLSSFAGASRELSEALIVNPYDTCAMAAALAAALTMPEDEQRDRLVLMREVVRQRNVHRWAAQMLLDVARIRKRERIHGRGAA